jgi:glycosyltransferase involved in cell wall biosynthesis
MHYTDASSSPFTRWAAARTDRIVAVSEYVRRAIASTAPRVGARASVVRNGVDTAYWAPQGSARSEGGAFRVAVVCRLTAWKRVHLAIEAAAGAGVALVIVGEGEQRGELERRARRLGGSVEFVGYQSDPRPWIAGCDVVASAARDEPLGLSVLEALSMGRPVVAFAGGGIPEIVQHGETGWLLADGSAEAMAGAFVEARSAPGRLSAMGQAARRFAAERCAVEAMCDGYAAAYRETSRPS